MGAKELRKSRADLQKWVSKNLSQTTAFVAHVIRYLSLPRPFAKINSR
jgi:hypothetical protein